MSFLCYRLFCYAYKINKKVGDLKNQKCGCLLFSLSQQKIHGYHYLCDKS